MSSGKTSEEIYEGERGIRCFFHFEKWGEERRLHRLGPVCLGCIEVDTSCADMSSSGSRSFDLGAESGNNGNEPLPAPGWLIHPSRERERGRESSYAFNGLRLFQGAI